MFARENLSPASAMTQAAVFVVLVFAVPWIVGPWLPQQPQTIWEQIASFVPGVWAPTVIAIVMMLSTDGVAGFGRQMRRFLRYPSGAGRWLAGAVLLTAFVVLAGVLAARAAGDGQPFIPLTAVGNVLLVALLTGAVGEELGWRAFLLSRLGRLMSPRNAALVMALLWALWHLPVFLFEDSPYASWPAVPALLTIASFGTLMGALFSRANGSVLATILAHLTLNVLLGVGGAQLSSPALWWTTCVLFGAAAFALFHRSSLPQAGVAGEVAKQR